MKTKTKDKLIKWTRQVFYRFKIHIKHYPSVKKTYNDLKVWPLEVQQYELRNVSKMINVTKDEKFYINLLKKYIPEWKMKIEQSEFLKGGEGRSSLNTARRANAQNKDLFEKVYFTGTRDLKALQWLLDHVFDLLKREGIKVPKIHKIYESSILTIVYFDFLKLIPLKKPYDHELISLSKVLYSISLENNDLISKAPDTLKNYSHHFQYLKNYELANAQLNQHKISSEKLEKIIEGSRKVLTHGDIHHDNLFRNNIIIDWDSFGIFPAGFEVAYLFFKRYKYEKVGFEMFSWLELHYKSLIPKEEWEVFQMNFSYFSFIFFCHLFDRGEHQNIRLELLDFLK